jgi:tRNA U54 and U55 pseudouridine synthase Pus10
MAVAGRLTDVERYRRYNQIEELRDQGKSELDISKELGIDIRQVHNGLKWLKTLEVANITNEELAEKRKEIYQKLAEAFSEAVEMYEKLKVAEVCNLCNGLGLIPTSDATEDNPKKKTCPVCKGQGHIWNLDSANEFFKRRLEVLDKMAKLYGLDNVNSGTTINQQFNLNEIPKEKVSSIYAEQIKKNYKKDFEQKLAKRYESEQNYE